MRQPSRNTTTHAYAPLADTARETGEETTNARSVVGVAPKNVSLGVAPEPNFVPALGLAGRRRCTEKRGSTPESGFRV